ncbi:hypothetical protein OIU76_018863 [Salix suchowensis]|nr:hypothetical protein OIU76_018863 [Salix suchowensis]
METTTPLLPSNESPSSSLAAVPEEEDYLPAASQTFRDFIKNVFWRETGQVMEDCGLNINGLELMLFIGINAAISVRVSNELGLGHPEAAKYSVYVTVLQSLVIGLVCMAVVLVAKDYFAYIFTSSKVMQVATSKLAFILAITMVLNSVQPVISGVAIGGGWQALVAYINIGCYYVFGLPLGFLLGYKANLGVEGVWGWHAMWNCFADLVSFDYPLQNQLEKKRLHRQQIA